MSKRLKSGILISFGLLFISIGVLNFIYIHFVPGLFYLAFALLYLPEKMDLFKIIAGVNIPFYLRVIAAFLLLWATLAVGDLVEFYESKYL